MITSCLHTATWVPRIISSTSSSVKRSPIVVSSSLSVSQLIWKGRRKERGEFSYLDFYYRTRLDVKRKERREQQFTFPKPGSSKHSNACLMVSSGSVPVNFSPNNVRNIVKLSCEDPGASAIISSSWESLMSSMPERGDEQDGGEAHSLSDRFDLYAHYGIIRNKILWNTEGFFLYFVIKTVTRMERWMPLLLLKHTKRIVRLLKVCLANEAVMVVVDEIERLFEFGNLFLVKHGKDVWGGTLGALLLGLATRLYIDNMEGWKLFNNLSLKVGKLRQNQ